MNVDHIPVVHCSMAGFCTCRPQDMPACPFHDGVEKPTPPTGMLRCEKLLTASLIVILLMFVWLVLE